MRRAPGVGIVLAMTCVATVAARQAPPVPAEHVLRVTSTADDGRRGTLRWAIDASNATPDPERIELEPGVHVLTDALPPIKGPVQIVGTAWARGGEHAVIDGSGYVSPAAPQGCPGAVAGQYGANVRTMTAPGLRIVDTADVEIAGVEVRHFCIGILINRSTRVTIRDSRIVENRGGAGIMLTGDDGQGNSTATTTNNNKVLRTEFVDNGDGLELTRGAAFNLVADNVFRSTAANPEPSQGIEILRGHDNVVSGNHFSGYSDGLQINWGNRNHIAGNTFTGNTFGLSLTGVGNVIEDNDITGNRIGIVVRPAEPMPVVRLSRNRVRGNAQALSRCEAGGSCDPTAPRGAMVFGLPGLEHAAFVGSRGGGVRSDPATLLLICPQAATRCQPAPNGGLPPPTLTDARLTETSLDVAGELRARPSARYLVELFGNVGGDDREGEMFLAQQPTLTDAQGRSLFTMRVNLSGVVRRPHMLTATITSADGATSPLSAPLRVLELSIR